MNPKLLTILFLVISSFGMAQNYTLKGKIRDAKNQETIPNATVLLLNVTDSAQVDGIISDLDGNFEIESIKEGDYLLKIQYLGYENYFRTIQLLGDLDLGTISISQEATDLQEVTIEARRATSQNKSDTTMFNADAFKTMRDASAQTLIEKLPGVTS
ncbi:MAG: carboxypeptidase-like regulatory domain-containing protein, partial [Cyclobacteriaceae bacterium]|nr:carboxypeptidase-like regulatory domain-containing protein [Cyclobacteriaceae bacterium]